MCIHECSFLWVYGSYLLLQSSILQLMTIVVKQLKHLEQTAYNICLSFSEHMGH